MGLLMALHHQVLGHLQAQWLPRSGHVSTQELYFKSLRPSDAYMRQKPNPSLVQIMACRLFGAKPLSEPMLEYC